MKILMYMQKLYAIFSDIFLAIMHPEKNYANAGRMKYENTQIESITQNQETS